MIDAEILRVRVLPGNDDDPVPAELDTAAIQKIEAFRAITGINLTGFDPHALRALFGNDAVHADRKKRASVTPPDRTVGALLAMWLERRRKEHDAGARSANSVSHLRKAMAHFREHVGPSNPVEAINFDVWEGWYLKCKGMTRLQTEDPKAGWSEITAGSYFRTARMFVRWLWKKEYLANPPRNLTDETYKFERPNKTPPTFTNEEINLLLYTAHGVHKLIVLLMLNTGATQQDVSDLRPDEIDLTTGRIIRFRSKMKGKKAARLVSYKLWPEVIELLRKHAATEGQRALVTRTEQPWVWREITQEGERKSDNVRSVFDKIKKRAGIKGTGKSVKVFRKTSATRIKSNKKFSDLRFWFLGQSEETIADTHYAANTQKQLDAAVDWLRHQYGFLNGSTGCSTGTLRRRRG